MLLGIVYESRCLFIDWFMETMTGKRTIHTLNSWIEKWHWTNLSWMGKCQSFIYFTRNLSYKTEDNMLYICFWKDLFIVLQILPQYYLVGSDQIGLRPHIDNKQYSARGKNQYVHVMCDICAATEPVNFCIVLFFCLLYNNGRRALRPLVPG